MTKAEKAQIIDEAINEILSNLKNGFEISEYEIDGIRIKKRSPLELIEELSKIKSSLLRKAPKHVNYVFKG